SMVFCLLFTRPACGIYCLSLGIADASSVSRSTLLLARVIQRPFSPLAHHCHHEGPKLFRGPETRSSLRHGMLDPLGPRRWPRPELHDKGALCGESGGFSKGTTGDKAACRLTFIR